MSKIYNKYNIWLTIDVEKITDTNFNINWKSKADLNYELLINNWIKLCDKLNYRSTCFVLGSFAKEYPNLVKKLHNNGHEISSHGINHNLVYNMKFSDWQESIKDSKKILEDIISDKVKGYRSASWSLPFNKNYYEALINEGYSYSSSYFPIKTYMYGNYIDKKEPFKIKTKSGTITEIPIPKYILPFSGGFYLRVLPTFIEKYLLKKAINKKIKPVIYIHPYELINNKSLVSYFLKYSKINLDFILAFYSTSKPIDKIECAIIQQ